LKEHLGPLMGKGKTFRHLVLDSYEAGLQNWTPGFREEFIKRKGYDPVPWLLLLDTKVVGEGKNAPRKPKFTVGNADQTARFLWDFKDMVAQLYQEYNFEQGARLMHEAGLDLQFESYGGPFDVIAGASVADIPMAEFWVGRKSSVKPAIIASARAMDRKVVGAEALTGWPNICNYSEDPALLKIFGDDAYSLGINRLILHHWVHQPFGDAFKPGMGMGWWGTHFGRNQTWAELGKAYYKYLGRSQVLLQTGQGVGDFLTLDHTVVNADAISRAALLRGDVRVENGQIVLASGRRYPFLVLPAGNVMLPEVARKLKELVEGGAVIVGTKPTRSFSLSGYPACDDVVRGIGEELWGDTDGRVNLEHGVGRGRVFAGSYQMFLEKTGLTSPVILGPEQGFVLTTARRDAAGDVDIFFVSNPLIESCAVTPSFRVKGKLPEIWQAEDGSHAPAPLWREVGGRTEVPLRLRGKEAVFIVFRKSAPADDHPVDIRFGSQIGPQIRILKATYGVADRTIDVTEKVADWVKNNTLQKMVMNRELAAGRGDPAPGVENVLRVDYEIEGKQVVREAKENAVLIFEIETPEWKLTTTEKGQPVLLTSVDMSGEIVYASGKHVPFAAKAQQPHAIEGAWEVSFAPGMDAPEKITFPELTSWSQHTDPAIKYFSGTAVYRKTIQVPADLLGSEKRIFLDLGELSNLASVKVNGVDLGIGWYAPFRFDATSALKAGANTLEINVVNTWVNRLIGDEQEPADIEWGRDSRYGDIFTGRRLVAYPDWFVKGTPRPSKGRKTFSTWNYFSKDAPLLPAGLIGPVKLVPQTSTRL
jgi:hypothetical protein